MTIVVAGFDFDRPISMHRLAVDFPELTEDSTPPTEEEIEQELLKDLAERLANPRKAYVLADSLLSRGLSGGRMPVAESAQKICEVPIEISKPDFDPYGGTTGRTHMAYNYTCGVSYAGSAQMWQLTLDLFRQAMKHLRYTWISSSQWDTPGHYSICCAGSSEDISTPGPERVEFDDEIDFAERDMPLLEAGFVAEVFGECLTMALSDHFPKEVDIQPLGAFHIDIDFVLMAYCLKNGEPKLYHFTWQDDLDAFPRGFKSKCMEVPVDDLVVLGHKSWKPNMMKARDAAISLREPIEPKVRGQMAASIKANAAANYVGGKIRCGYLDSLGVQTRLFMHSSFKQLGFGDLPGLKGLDGGAMVERALRDVMVVSLAVRHQRRLQLGA